jgi:hypothetical protein
VCEEKKERKKREQKQKMGISLAKIEAREESV